MKKIFKTTGYLFLAMRPHQWAKGIFIFLPLVFGQKLFAPWAFKRTTLMFIAFSMAASAMYLINDIIDIREDKNHPEKRLRPFAAGKITVLQSLCFAALLGIAAIFYAFRGLGVDAGSLILVYLCLNYLYMRYLKHAVIIDVFMVGGFFYLRILAGAISSGIKLSNWIIMCTVLLALFLGFNKRKYDLEFSREHRPVFEKYNPYFVDRMISIIAAAIVISYSLYVMDPATALRFGTQHLIYSVPFVYYGIFRYIYLIDTKWWGGDPARILTGDYKIQLTLVLWLAVCVGVIYFKL